MKQIRVALSSTTHNKAAQRKPSPSSLEGKLEALVEKQPWLRILTTTQKKWAGRLELGTSATDKILRCVSGEKEPPRALQQTGALGLEVLKLLADPKARSEALARSRSGTASRLMVPSPLPWHWSAPPCGRSVRKKTLAGTCRTSPSMCAY